IDGFVGNVPYGNVIQSCLYNIFIQTSFNLFTNPVKLNRNSKLVINFKGSHSKTRIENESRNMPFDKQVRNFLSTLQLPFNKSNVNGFEFGPVSGRFLRENKFSRNSFNDGFHFGFNKFLNRFTIQ